MRRATPLLLGAVLLGSLLLVASALVAPRSPFAVRAAHAQSPEEQALRIERQLLCPQCVNLRLDVCDTLICQDMRAEIRTRLAAGESGEAIVASFERRYGVRVLADPPYRGFTRVLPGWGVLATLLVAVGGGVALVAMRRSARATDAAAAADAGDDRWLDEQLARDSEAR